MRNRLITGIVAATVALGALAFPGATPVQAASTTCTGWTSKLTPPSVIRVYRTTLAKTETLSFRWYVEKVMASEWGATAPDAALRVGAIAVKQYAWYYAMYWRGGKDAAGRCYDVRDSSIDQVYNPGKATVPRHAAAVAATWRISLRKGEVLFLTGYRPGTGYCKANLDGWHLFQRDAMDCVRRYGDRAELLARRFFSSLSWITPGLGDWTGDGAGDLATLTADPTSGAAKATICTNDVAYKSAGLPCPLTSAVLTAVPPEKVLGRAAGDVDGDGRMDLVQLIAADDGLALEVMKGSATGLLPAVRWWSDATDPTDLSAGSFRLVVTDFTSDGRADAGIVRIRPAQTGATPMPAETSLLLAASTGAAFGPVRQTWTTAADLSAATFMAGDISGDAQGDLVILAPVEGGGTALQVALGSQTADLGAPTTWATEPLPLDSIKALVADPTRDGRDDVVVVRKSGADNLQVVVYVASGAGRSFVPTPFTAVLPLSFAGSRFSSSDIAVDGRADLFALVNKGVDGTGASLGTDAIRFDSLGTSFLQVPWFTSATMPWESTFPF